MEKVNFGTDLKEFDRDQFEKMRVQWYNEEVGKLDDGVNCDICKNKGMIMYLKDERSYMKSCECMKKREQIKRAKASGLGDYLSKRSKDYKDEEDWQKHNKAQMIKYCQNHSDDEKWFMCVGSVGAGKTLLCSIIANHFLYNLGKSVLYITWTDFISKLKRDMMGDNTNQVSGYLEEVKNVEVLFIDEMIKKFNETDLKYLIEIINYRYQNKLKTLITSEKNIGELLDIDEATMSRAVEMCGEFVIDIPKDRSKNYRLKNIKF